ncbi:MAG: RNA methyltransferase [Actinobacteria bacterium]|nr:RNA methyltransferase [Actinomycetota bacterium]
MRGVTEPVVIRDRDDPRISAYVSLTDVELRRAIEVVGSGAPYGRFIVEGALALDRLLSSAYAVESVLVSARLRPLVDATAARLPRGVPIYVADPTVLNAVVGFNLHRGVVACAHRPAPVPVDRVVSGTRRLVVLEGVNDHENLGGIFRNAAAFGARGVLLDATCADPLYRRAVRVSLGHVLGVGFTRVHDIREAMADLRARGWMSVALTPSRDAPPLADLDPMRPNVAVVLGSEGPGLRASTISSADARARIPLADGVDSLNVAVAAGIALHHFSPGLDADVS